MPMKLTMKDPYSKTRFFSVRVRGYIDLLRPFTLLAPIFVSIFIMSASLVYNNAFSRHYDWFWIILQSSATLAIINGASNALNQSTDAEGDIISKPYRPIPRGIVERDEAQSIAYILYFFALLRAVTINTWFGIFVFLIMVFTVMYSLPPRMKQYLFINQIWIAIPRGFLGILASWSVFGDPLQKEPLLLGLVAFLFFVGAMSTKDIVDREADKKTGIRTLINTYGIKTTAYISLPFLIIPFAAFPLFIHYQLLKGYLLPLTIFVIPSAFIFYFMLQHHESKTLENVHAWSLMYVTYLFYAVGFSTLVILGETGNLPVIVL